MVFASSDVGIETIAVLGFDAMKLLYLLDDRYQKGMEEGMEKGMEKGKEEGIAEGMEKGRAEGKHEANTETAQRLLAMGLSAEQVAKATQLPLEIIKNLSNS